MHRSRLSTVLVDVPAADAPGATAFWSAALGVPTRRVPGEEQCTELEGALPGLELAVQAVDDAPRSHVDVETDDVSWRPAAPAGDSNSPSLPPSRWIHSTRVL